MDFMAWLEGIKGLKGDIASGQQDRLAGAQGGAGGGLGGGGGSSQDAMAAMDDMASLARPANKRKLYEE